jgi:replicative DNA helicase
MPGVPDWRTRGTVMNNAGARMRRSDGIDPKLPASEDIEREIVAAFLYGHRDSHLIFDTLTIECFQHVLFARVFATAQKLYEVGKPVDPMAVSDAMDAAELASIGGLQGIGQISTGMYGAYNVAHACRLLQDKAQLRALIRVLEKIQADAWEINGDGADIQTFIEESSFKIAAIANQMDSASDDATDYDAGMQMMELFQDKDTVRIGCGDCGNGGRKNITRLSNKTDQLCERLALSFCERRDAGESSPGS